MHRTIDARPDYASSLLTWTLLTTTVHCCVSDEFSSFVTFFSPQNWYSAVQVMHPVWRGWSGGDGVEGWGGGDGVEGWG